MAGDVDFVTGFRRKLKDSRRPIKQKLGIKVYDQDRFRVTFTTKKADVTPKLRAGAQDSCHVDSGSLLMKLQKVWTLESVMSFGNRCDLEDWPGIYSEVLAYMFWFYCSYVLQFKTNKPRNRVVYVNSIEAQKSKMQQ